MTMIGTIPVGAWKECLKIAHSNKFKTRQQPDCPYIILMRVTNMQAICLSGYFHKQAVDLFLVEIDAPQINERERIPIPDEAYWEARSKANDLLSMALHNHAQFVSGDTSSTNNQPGLK